MPTKAVTVTGVEGRVTSVGGQDAGGGQGLVGALVQAFNTLLRTVSNLALSASAVAVATVTTQVKTTATLNYLINGVFKTKAATDNFWTVAIIQAAQGFAVIPDGSRAMFLFLIDAAGVASVIQGPVGVTDAQAIVPADTIPEDKCIAGVCKAVCAGTSFTPGTDAWSKASVTFTFSDGYDATIMGSFKVTRA